MAEKTRAQMIAEMERTTANWRKDHPKSKKKVKKKIKDKGSEKGVEMFSIRRKGGTVRESCHGVKTKRGDRIYVDCPTVGSVCLLDDIHKLKVSLVDGPFPFTYKMEGYEGQQGESGRYAEGGR